MKYESLEQRVIAAKSDENELEELIREYMPYIRSKSTEVIPPARFDQYSSTAMEAFAEAIGAFDEEKGSFLGFASLVIKRRIKDQIRREYKPGEVPTEEIEEVTTIGEDSERAIEIEMFRVELQEYGIRLMDLPGASPKHKGSKEKADNAAAVIFKSTEMMSILVSTGKLPVTRLSKESEVPVKLIEKKRKYIIARALLHQDKYGYLKEYIR
jgi:RNA polymerase sigma factor